MESYRLTGLGGLLVGRERRLSAERKSTSWNCCEEEVNGSKSDEAL